MGTKTKTNENEFSVFARFGDSLEARGGVTSVPAGNFWRLYVGASIKF